MSPQPVPPFGSSRPHQIGRDADLDDDVVGHEALAPEAADTEGHTRTRVVPTVAGEGDEDDVEGHGLGLNLAVASAVLLGAAGAGAAVSTASATVVAPGASSSTMATPTPMPSPSPAAPGSAAAKAASESHPASTGRVGGMIHSGVYVVPARTTPADIETV